MPFSRMITSFKYSFTTPDSERLANQAKVILASSKYFRLVSLWLGSQRKNRF